MERRGSRNAPRRTNGSDMTRREAADYIATLVEDLKSIAQAAGSPPDCLSSCHGQGRGTVGMVAERMKPGPLLFWLDQRYKLLSVPMQPSREIKLEQHAMDLAHGDARRPGNLVDIDRARAQSADNPLALGLGGYPATARGLRRPRAQKAQAQTARPGVQAWAPESRRCRARS